MITQDLESVWPGVSLRLASMLRRRGVGRHDADEAIQETAARAISGGVEFIDGDDLFRWASVVSWRVAIDARRRCTRMSSDEVPDRADYVDVAQAAEHRIVLSAVTNRFKELPERDQALLLEGLDSGAPVSRLESVRVAVARHRARNRLRGLLNGLAAPVVAFIARRGRWRSAPVEAFLATAAPAFACFALTLGAVGGQAPSPTVQPTNAAAVVPIAEKSVTPAANAAPVVRPTISTPTHATTPTPSPSSRPSADASVHIPAGAGPYPASADIRPKQASDHVACVTLPSLTGPATTCVDPPIPGR